MPTRQEAITALYGAQSKPKVALPPTEGTDRPSSAGMIQVGAPFVRVRDRMTIEKETQQIVALRPKTEQEKLADIYLAAYEKRRAEEAAAVAAKERKREEIKAAEEGQRRKAEHAARARVEAQERQSAIVVRNIIRAEIRSILKDASAEETVEVLKRVKSEHVEGLPFAYSAHLAALREERREHEYGQTEA